MKRLTTFLFLTAFLCLCVPAQDRTANFDAEKMRVRVKRLSADDFEGRGPGTAGGRLASQYIADQLKASGVKPANKGTYFQNVKLVGVKADPLSYLQVWTAGEASGSFYKFGDDFVATTGAQTANVSVDA